MDDGPSAASRRVTDSRPGGPRCQPDLGQPAPAATAHAPDATTEDLQECTDHAEELTDSGSLVAAYALTPRDMATSIRGDTITDGPFLDAKEVVAGCDRLAHAGTSSYEQTDWPQILALYDRLLVVWPSPVVRLNRTVALAMVAGPEVALAEIRRLEADDRLAGYHYLPAVKADLLSRLGRPGDAAVAYRQAFALSANEAERTFLAAQIADHTFPA